MADKRKLIYSTYFFLALIAIILFLIIRNSLANEMKVVFFDIGQGDSILISRGSDQFIIDGGANGNVLLEKVGRFMPFWDRKIEFLEITHPDQDHIGGFIELFENYKIENVIRTNAKSDSKTFQALESAIQKEGAMELKGEKGLRVIFSDQSKMEILYPFGELASDTETNEGSIVTVFSYGSSRFLLTGDLPSNKESKLIEAGENLKSDFLKVGHHGSKYSSSKRFLQAVKPKEAVISAGKNNRYGHPNAEVIDRLNEEKIKIFRTDELGDIRYSCKKSGCYLDKSQWMWW